MDLMGLFSVDAILAVFTLTFLEIVLGIDNIVFITIITNKLEEKLQAKARNIGLMLAMAFRIIMLFGITWVLSLNKPFYSIKSSIVSADITFQSLIILFGGLFLVYKSVSEIHDKIEGTHGDGSSGKKTSLNSAIFQIAILNLVFSFDSILTAIGLVSLDAPPIGFGQTVGMSIMVISIVVSIIIMLRFAGPVSDFVNKNPTIQILGLSFLILIGIMLLAEGAHLAHLSIFDSIHLESVPKGYLYFGIAFALSIELINMRIKKGKNPVKFHNTEIQKNSNK